MRQMTKPERPRGGLRSDRRHWKSFRVSDAELLELEAKARAAGVTVSDLIRDELLDGESDPTPRDKGTGDGH
jgi:hypothetical protein